LIGVIILTHRVRIEINVQHGAASMKPQPVEFLGGPLDGVCPAVAPSGEQFSYRDGNIVHVYTIDEVYEGPGVRRVFRHTGVFAIGPERRVLEDK